MGDLKRYRSNRSINSRNIRDSISVKNANDYIKFKKSETRYIIKKKLNEMPAIGQNSGYQKMLSNPKRPIKVLWGICFVISICLFSYMIFKSIKNYLKFDVVTKIRMNDEIPTRYPTISICNIDPFVTENASKFIVDVYRNKLGLNVTKENWHSKEVYEIVRNSKQMMLSNAFNPKLEDEIRKSFGFMLKDILHKCTYNLNTCSDEDFTWFFSFDHGNCFRFNSGLNSNKVAIPIRNSTKPGGYYGLKLYFVLGSSNNYFGIAESEGLKIFVHNNSFEPLSFEGIEAKSATMTNIAIKRTFTYKSPAPYSDCIDVTKSKSVLYKHIAYSKKVYRQIDCLDLCLQRYIIDQCSCYYLKFQKLFDIEPCLNNTDVDCAKEHYVKFIEKNIKEVCSADCPLECSHVNYEFSISSSNFPTYDYYRLYKNDKSFIEHNLKDYNISFESFKNRALAVNIFYPQLKYTVITEIQKTSIFDLLSTIGGELGLFLGMSILSFIEIIEILFEICIIMIKRKLKE